MAQELREDRAHRHFGHGSPVLAELPVNRRASWAQAAGAVVLAVGGPRLTPPSRTCRRMMAPSTSCLSAYGEPLRRPGDPDAERLRPAAEYAAHGFSSVNTPLEAWLGWRLGLSCSLAIIVLATAIGFACLVRAVEPRRWPVAFLGFPLALSWELYMGFFPFTVGAALGLLVLALAVAWREPARLRPVVLAFLLFLQAIRHVFTAALTGLVLAALLVARTPGGWRARAREGLRVALIGAPAAGILLVAVLDRGSQVSTPFAHETLVQPLLMSLAELPRLVAPGPWWRGLLLLLVVGVAVVLGALRLGRKEANATDATFLVAGVTLLAAGALTPLHVPGWQFFSPRFLLLGVFLCLATIPVERLGRPELVVGLAAASLSFSAVWLVASAALHRRLAAACDDAIQGLSAPVVRHSLRLPIELAPQGGLPFDPVASEVPWLMPLRHMPMLYALVEGGAHAVQRRGQRGDLSVRDPRDRAEGAAHPGRRDLRSAGRVHPVRRRPGVPSRRRRPARDVRHVLRGGARDRGARGRFSLLRARGFADDWARGSVLIAHFVPCRLDVTIPRDGDVPRVDVGVGSQTILRDEAPAPGPGADGARHLVLPNAPCGEVWVRPHGGERRQDGTVAPTFCRNADAAGAIAATLTWSAANVGLRLQPRASLRECLVQQHLLLELVRRLAPGRGARALGARHEREREAALEELGRCAR